ncbi:MAG: hypothetical protein O9256_00655 [Rhizobiaceae bacterium]|nr:hypothetical protein [Rhizobiaceae bacterium]
MPRHAHHAVSFSIQSTTLKGLVLGVLLIPTSASAQTETAPNEILPESVKRVDSGIEAKIRITHEPETSQRDQNRSFNETVMTFVVRCRDRYVAAVSKDHYQTYANRELVETVNWSSTFQPVPRDTYLGHNANALCTNAEYASFRSGPRPVDAGLPPLILVCRDESRTDSTPETHRINFSDSTVDDGIASISASEIAWKYPNRAGNIVSNVIDRYTGTKRWEVIGPSGERGRSFVESCKKTEARAF